MAFRDNILHLRATNNMTQEQLAVLLGVSRQSVAKWESGKSSPEMDKLIKMCQLFDCSLDDLVQGDLTSHQPTKINTIPSTSQDIFGYDEHMLTFAKKISNGIMYILLGVALGVFVISLGDADFLYNIHALNENILSAFGIALIFIGVALGLANLIPASMAHSDFIKEHPYLEDFYTQSQKQKAKRVFTNQLIGGIICIFAGISFVIALDNPTTTDNIGILLLLLFVAVGVRFIVHGSMVLGRVDIRQYNMKASEIMDSAEIESAEIPADQKKELMYIHKKDKRVGAVCGAIMITATIIALLMLFVPLTISGDSDGGYNHSMISLFWLPWPIGGLLCGIATLIIKGFGTED